MTKVISVRTAGGVASQLMALMAAIRMQKTVGFQFVIHHNSTATGAYYPFAISKILARDEFLPGQSELELNTNSIILVPGAHIKSHELFKDGLNYEKFLKIFRRLHLEKQMYAMKKQWCIDYEEERIDRVPRWADAIVGGYPPFRSETVRQELNERFHMAGIPIELELPTNNSRQRVVIHHRLGDKRLTHALPTTVGDGIIDPSSYMHILRGEANPSDLDIFVVSEEPEVASQLLRSYGVSAKINPFGRDIWSDLRLMLSANLLIGTWSTVSQLAACLIDFKDARVFYPETDGTLKKPKWSIPGMNTYKPQFLPKSHFLYNASYTPNPNSFNVY